MADDGTVTQPSSNQPDTVVVAQGGVRAMQELCDVLRASGLDAALARPPGGCVSG